MPAAEFELTADLVRRLLAGQHPDLAGLPVQAFANGWDNTLFRLVSSSIASDPSLGLPQTRPWSNSSTCVSRMLLPEGSRNDVSMP